MTDENKINENVVITNNMKGSQEADFIRGKYLVDICRKEYEDYKNECERKKPDNMGFIQTGCNFSQSVAGMARIIKGPGYNIKEDCKEASSLANKYVEEYGKCKQKINGQERKFRCFKYHNSGYDGTAGLFGATLDKARRATEAAGNIGADALDDVIPDGKFVKLKCDVFNTKDGEMKRYTGNSGIIMISQRDFERYKEHDNKEIDKNKKIIEQDLSYNQILPDIIEKLEIEQSGFTNIFNNGINIDSDNVYFFLLSILLCYIIFKMIYKK